jgi:predicted signal transduction protein with EAL and GGDEF domain
VVALAERVVRMMGEPFSVDGQQVTLSARIGIALHPTDAGSPELLQRKAEMALEHARVAGQGQYRFADPDTDRRMRQGRAMADELRVALQDGELALDFRPLCDSGSLERIGGVAHLCWEHPAVGVVPPDELVRVAEEFGLIARLGLWVLEAACEAAKAWDTSLRVMVRLWPPQLRQRDLPGAVAHVLARAGLAPERLVLAIPESALAGDEPEHVLRTLEGLKARGVALAQDGVGNGSTALTQLRRFPLDLLVIDTPLVRALTEGGAGSEEAESMVRAIMALGLSLKLEVAFEGAGDGAEPDWPRAEVSAPRLAAPVDVAVPQRVGQRTSG